MQIFGGNGYVGQNIVSSLVKRSLFSGEKVEIISVSRSGGLPTDSAGLIKGEGSTAVSAVKGDILNPTSYRDVIANAHCVISCVGAFGSNEFMEKMNGDANVLVSKEARAAGSIIIAFSPASLDLIYFFRSFKIHLCQYG